MTFVDRCVFGRAMPGAADTADLKCLRCGYSMVGLTRAVCPECGQDYTLEQLVASPNAGIPAS
jgi:hypothetical protein